MMVDSVALVAGCSTAGLAKRTGRSFGRLPVDVQDANDGTFGRETPGDRAANAAGAARDNDRLVS